TSYSSVSTTLRNLAPIRCVRASLYVLGLGRRVSRCRRGVYIVDSIVANDVL
ncbi:hypothetical protein MPH_07508, partial [Macrophomina phaseolina MS6]